MKKTFLFVFATILLVGCTKHEIVPTPQSVSEDLKIA